MVFALHDGERVVPALWLFSRIGGSSVGGAWASVWWAIHSWAHGQASQDYLVRGDLERQEPLKPRPCLNARAEL